MIDPPPIEVIASSADKETASHIRIAGLVIERAKRLTEMGRDTLVLLDSLTRLARAHKTAGSGRTMSGGIDTKAMEVPKRSSARRPRFDEGGTLDILGTALIETGSRMDEVIFRGVQGAPGTWNCVLNRARGPPSASTPRSDLGGLCWHARKEERLLLPDML